MSYNHEPRLAKPKKPERRDPEFEAVIRKEGKKTVRIDSWRFYSILDALRWCGAERQDAQDAAKRCGRTHEEITFKVGDITVELKEKKEKGE